MEKTIKVQTTGILLDTKEKANKIAQLRGFGNLQNAIRIFVSQLAEDKIDLSLTPRDYLSSEKAKEYREMSLDDSEWSKPHDTVKGLTASLDA